MELNQIISFLIAAMLFTISPGPDTIYVITESLTKGIKSGISCAYGFVSGIVFHTLIVATGVALVLQKSEYAFTIIKYCGSAYILYMAYGAIKEKPLSLGLDAVQVKSRKTYFQNFRKCFLMNVLNPKVSIFFIAFLPQFVQADGYLATVQMLILGGVFMAQASIIMPSIAIISGSFANALNRPKFWSIVKWFKVAVLLFISITLLFSHV